MGGWGESLDDNDGLEINLGAIFTKANCQAAVMVKADLTNANVEDANFR